VAAKETKLLQVAKRVYASKGGDVATDDPPASILLHVFGYSPLFHIHPLMEWKSTDVGIRTMHHAKIILMIKGENNKTKLLHLLEELRQKWRRQKQQQGREQAAAAAAKTGTEKSIAAKAETALTKVIDMLQWLAARVVHGCQNEVFVLLECVGRKFQGFAETVPGKCLYLIMSFLSL